MILKRFPVAALALLLVAVPAFAQTKVGIANPIRILNELAETKEINKTMESETATFKIEVASREDKLKNLTAQRDALKPDAPQWADMNNQLVKARTDAQAWAAQTQAEMQRKFRDQAKRMRDKIMIAISEVAKTKGLDLIMSDQKPEVPDAQMEQMQPQQVLGVLFGRNILFSNPSVDVTQDVIAKLDAGYKK